MKFLFWLCWFKPHVYQYVGPKTNSIFCERCGKQYRHGINA